MDQTTSNHRALDNGSHGDSISPVSSEIKFEQHHAKFDDSKEHGDIQYDHTYTSIGPNARRLSRIPHKWTVYLSISLLLTTLIAPPIVFGAWYSRVFQAHHLNMFDNAPIGGEFRQLVAKAIDLVSSAILAPILIAGLNILWFRLARTAIFNEKPHDQKPMTLSAIIESSVTSSGSYDLIKLFTLLRTFRVRTSLLALLALLAAVASTALTNIIAYEAFSVERSFDPNSRPTLRKLHDAQFDGTYNSSLQFTDSSFMFPNISSESLAVEYTNTMNGIAFRGYDDTTGNSLLTDDHYLAYNVTQDALDNLNTTITDLWDVPAYRQRVTCEPANFSLFSVMQSGEQAVEITLGLSGNSTWDRLYNNYIPGTISEMNNSYNSQYTFVGVNTNGTRFLLTAIASGFYSPNTPLEPSSEASPYGQIPYYLANLNGTFSGTKATMKVWGLSCSLQRQTGLVNLTALGASRTWSIASTAFSDDWSAATKVSSVLNSMQAMYLYHAPGATLGGYGGAIGQTAMRNDYGNVSMDWSTYARNFLYASAEMERKVLNLAIANTTSALAEADMVRVAGRHEILRYRITYIPFLLVVAIICITASAAVVVSVVGYSWHTVTSRDRGMVDPLRLIVDFAAATRGRGVEDAGTWSRNQLREWGRRRTYRYEEKESSGGIVLSSPAQRTVEGYSN